jgi:hypothetical protein
MMHGHEKSDGANSKFNVPLHTRGGSRMRESCTSGSMRGARGNSRPYRDLGRASLLMSSRAEELHLRALPEPYVNLSIHTAPDVRPFP